MRIPLSASLGCLVTVLAGAAILNELFQPKQMPRAAMCRSNLKQLGSALLMYVEDYDRRLPPTAYAIGTRSYTLPWLLHPYLKNGLIWECSTAARDGTRGHEFDGSSADHLVSYGYNGHSLGHSGVLFDRIPNPSGVLAFVDSSSSLAAPPLLVPALGGTAPVYRHAEIANVTWLDGHVTAARAEIVEASASEEAGARLSSGIDRYVHWNLR
jgi:prepilin-type processing-associated H-X9-DG protein